MRSVLTTLGVIIGVGVVIIMVSVGIGAKEEINKMIDKLGANIMMVHPGHSIGRGVAGGAGSLPTLTEADAWAIRDEVPTVELTAPTVRGSAQLIAGNLKGSPGPAATRTTPSCCPSPPPISGSWAVPSP